MADFLEGTLLTPDKTAGRVEFLLVPNADTAVGAAFFWCPSVATIAARSGTVGALQPWPVELAEINGPLNQFSMLVRAAPVAPGSRQVTFELVVRQASGDELVRQRYSGKVDPPEKPEFQVTDLVRLALS